MYEIPNGRDNRTEGELNEFEREIYTLPAYLWRDGQPAERSTFWFRRECDRLDFVRAFQALEPYGHRLRAGVQDPGLGRSGKEQR